MTTQLDHQAELIGRFFDGTLDVRGTEELLVLVQKDLRVHSLLIHSFRSHLLLQEKYQEEKTIHHADSLCKITDLEIEQAIASGRYDDLDRYVEKVRLTPAMLSVPKVEPRKDPRRLLKGFLKLFVPKENERWSESTAPIVWVTCILVLMVVFGSILIFRIPQGEEEPLPQVARVENCYEAVWAPGAIAYRPGSEVGSNELQLESGEVQLVLGSGAKLILSGPCQFTVADPQRGICMQGRVSARLPKGVKGLEIVTPFGSVIDRSTAFSLDLTSKQLEVEVVEGKVDIRDDSGHLWNLSQGMARRLTSLQPPQEIAYQQKVYIDPAEFQKKIEQRDHQERIRQLEAARELNQSPGLILRYDFASGKKPENEAAYGQSLVSSLSMTGGTWSRGELSGMKALRFSQPGDSASVAIQGKYKSMTLSARVRIERLDNQANILFGSDDFLYHTGGFCWQINRDGRIQFQLTPPSRSGKVCFDTMPVITKDILGTWVQLTVTIDSEKKMIRQYINGRMIGTSRLEEVFDLEPGFCTIGNIKPGSKSFGPRYMGGSISEITLREGVVLEQHEDL